MSMDNILLASILSKPSLQPSHLNPSYKNLASHLSNYPNLKASPLQLPQQLVTASFKPESKDRDEFRSDDSFEG